MGATNSTGALISPYDSRDYSLDLICCTASATSALPSSYRTTTTVPTLNQGSTSTCVACALASCRYIQEELQEGNASQFSVNYIYGNRLNTDLQTDGMYPRQALKTIKDFGDCHWSDFSGYSTYEVAKSAYNENKDEYDYAAYPYKINSYYHLYTEDDIKTAVYELGCAIISYNITTDFDKPDENGYVVYDSTSATRGNHCVTIIGWTEDNHWIVLNSWGEDYGLNGYCYVPFSYPFNEAWAMVDNNRYQELISIRTAEEVLRKIKTSLGIKKTLKRK